MNQDNKHLCCLTSGGPDSQSPALQRLDTTQSLHSDIIFQSVSLSLELFLTTVCEDGCKKSELG